MHTAALRHGGTGGTLENKIRIPTACTEISDNMLVIYAQPMKVNLHKYT